MRAGCRTTVHTDGLRPSPWSSFSMLLRGRITFTFYGRILTDWGASGHPLATAITGPSYASYRTHTHPYTGCVSCYTSTILSEPFCSYSQSGKFIIGDVLFNFYPVKKWLLMNLVHLFDHFLFRFRNGTCLSYWDNHIVTIIILYNHLIEYQVYVWKRLTLDIRMFQLMGHCNDLDEI